MGYTSMGKASGENVISLGTEAWNIADGFTKIKILKILIEIDLLETFAMFGYQSLDEDNFNPADIPRRRTEAFDRLLFSLRQLIGNCHFSIDDKRDKEVIRELQSRIDNVEAVSDGVARIVHNDLTKEEEIIIDEQHFRNCFNVLRSIKDELNFPINRAGLIFRHSDEIDLDKMMREIQEGG